MPKGQMPKADFALKTSDGAEAARLLVLTGDWTATGLRDVAERLKKALTRAQDVQVDVADIGRFDTAGAYALKYALGDRASPEIFAGHENYRRIYELIDGISPEVQTQISESGRSASPLVNFLSGIGQKTLSFLDDARRFTRFLGETVTFIFLTILNPGRIRWTPLVAQMQRTGLEALIVVGVANFFVGAVVAFLGILQLKQFGVSVFAVELIGIAVLREFGPVIAAVLMAGRSASSFTAEVGAMKMNQEIDAMRVMGINPFDALVLPRLFAMIITMPLATFFGMMAGLFGGFIVVWTTLGYGPNFFIQRMTDYVPFVNYFVGLIKVPFFAAAIALIGCRMGMEVKEDVISLGKQVTSSVVQAIFAIITIDAIFAIMFNGFDF
ncbi:ABC transporter permease [Asticcacaulis tiandongensis]|uniref:ABC transporter permease n=1 Tax=Asticcacaulis tiandongensis TaxID=2565365 RepID=UPI001FEBDDC6|nr:MlaE family lipid ABC transporter permease subunit [Asticcacaulis tiandongensis]